MTGIINDMEPNQTWRPPPADLILGENGVHVWRADLAQPDDLIRLFERTLSGAELKKASNFRFEHLKKNFIASQGILRIILGRYLDTAPGRITFRQNQYGKPFLSGHPGSETLEFNLSHSRGLALYAVTRGRSIGVDIEYSGDIPDIDAIVARFFSPGERKQFFALPDDQRIEAFYRGWTHKEAFIKAIGQGLYLPLDHFEVSLAPGEKPCLLWIQDEPDEITRWSMKSLVPAPDYLGAVVVKGRRLQYSCWHMPVQDMFFHDIH